MMSLASLTRMVSGAMVRGTGRRMKGMGGGEEDEGEGRRMMG